MLRTALAACSAAAVCAAAPKVQLKVYAESLCPSCQGVLNLPVNQTLTYPGMADIVDYEYIPFANAYMVSEMCGGTPGQYDHDVIKCWDSKCSAPDAPADCFSGEVVCQHGQEECDADSVEMCAIDASGNDWRRYAPFVYCYEAKDWGPKNSSLAPCAASSGIAAADINACMADAAKVRALTVAAAKKTVALGAVRTGAPWITINGKAATWPVTNLVEQVCSAYNGTKPLGCLYASREA